MVEIRSQEYISIHQYPRHKFEMADLLVERKPRYINAALSH